MKKTPSFFCRQFGLLKMLIHTLRAKREIPVGKARTGINLSKGHNPSVNHQLPVKTVPRVDIGRGTPVSDLRGNINMLSMTTEVATDSSTIDHSAPGARNDSAQELVSIGKSQPGVIHHLSPDLIKEAQHRREQAILQRETRRLRYTKILSHQGGHVSGE